MTSSVTSDATSAATSAATKSVDKPTAQPDKPAANRWAIFAIAGFALMMSSIDQTIVATALSAIGHDLHARINWTGWTITIYTLGRTLVLPVSGRFSDQFGRRRVFQISIAIFTLASLACGFATNIVELIVLRAVQSLGGGAFIPSATGIVADRFGRDRDRAIGLFSSILPLGTAIGPLLGGFFVQYWTWRAIFLINIPIGVAIFTASAFLLPPSERKTAARPDFAGLALMAATLLGVMIALTDLGSGGSDMLATVAAPLVVAAGACVVFVRHSRRHPNPVVPARFLYGPRFGAANALNTMYGAVAVGFSGLVPLYAVDRYGLRALSSGTLLTARAIGMAVLAVIAAYMLRRTGYRRPILVGFSIAAVSMVALWHRPIGLDPYAWLATASLVTGIGMGMVSPATNNAVLELARDQIATISGVRSMFRQIGAIIAVSTATAIAARSDHPGTALATVFLAFAIALVCSMPLVFRLPDHRGPI